MSIQNQIKRGFLVAASGLALLAAAGAATAEGPEDAISIDEIQVIENISASDARRRAYEYMASLGYVQGNTIGGARVRDVTREGDTFVVRVSYGAGSRILRHSALLYIDAATAVVSEQPPTDGEGRVAAN